MNQYRRHKPLDSDSVVGLARVFPEPDDEEEPELTENDDNVSICFLYRVIHLVVLC